MHSRFPAARPRATTLPPRRVLVLALAFALLCAGVLFSMPARSDTPYLSRPEVREFIDTLNADHGLEVAELERILGDARPQPVVVRLMGPGPRNGTPAAKPAAAASTLVPALPPGQSPASELESAAATSTPSPVRHGAKSRLPPYPPYRARFVNPRRIDAALRYWSAYEPELRRAEAEFGVPAEVILGILGVETAFGRTTGTFRVLDALATIAFDGRRRQDYFREELKQFLLLSSEHRLDPLAIRGSYAGAIGLPQFMPSSYRRYAVDYDQDGRTDLLDSPADAIGSVARFLQQSGWQPGQAALLPVRLPRGREAQFVTGLQRSQDTAALRKAGVKFPSADAPPGACAIVALPGTRKQPTQYVAGFANFEAVTQYNRSTFYATAVLQLAEAVRVARERQPGLPGTTTADTGRHADAAPRETGDRGLLPTPPST